MGVENGGDEVGGEYVVSDVVVEWGGFVEFFIEMDGVGVG